MILGSLTSYPGHTTAALFTAGNGAQHISDRYVHIFLLCPQGHACAYTTLLNDTILVSFVKEKIIFFSLAVLLKDLFLNSYFFFKLPAYAAISLNGDYVCGFRVGNKVGNGLCVKIVLPGDLVFDYLFTV